MKRVIACTLLALLAGCASVVKVEGEQLIANRMSVKVGEAWNKINLPGQSQPYEVWTQNGLTLDHLRFWAAIKGGQSLIAMPPGATAGGKTPPRLPTYRVGMSADELAGLFELMYAADGSLVTMGKVEPARFAGEPGVRCEFTVARKSDGVQLQGVAWLAVRSNELFAAALVAPRLAFFPKELPLAEAIVRTVTIK